MLKSARLQYGDLYDFFPRSHVFTHHSKELLSRYFDQPGRLWIGKPAASSQGRGIHLTTSLRDFEKYLAPLPTSHQSLLHRQRSNDNTNSTNNSNYKTNVNISAAETQSEAQGEPATKKGRDVVIVPLPYVHTHTLFLFSLKPLGSRIH